MADPDILELCCNLDDMNPEHVPYVMDLLFSAGARDAWCTPIIMKGGRPGFTLNVLCEPESRLQILEILFSETSTLGVRWTEMQRQELKREIQTIETEYGSVEVKVALDKQGRIMNIAPEHRDCRKLAESKGVPLKDIYQAAMLALKNLPQNT